MPLYEYDCHHCEESVEVLLSRSDETPECPTCGSQELTRLLSVTATPTVRQGMSLPTATENCGAPRCCGGGGCQM